MAFGLTLNSPNLSRTRPSTSRTLAFRGEYDYDSACRDNFMKRIGSINTKFKQILGKRHRTNEDKDELRELFEERTTLLNILMDMNNQETLAREMWAYDK